MDVTAAFDHACPRLVFVAATGGHLEQLFRIAANTRHHPASTWVTFRNKQSESLLSGKRVQWIDEIQSRDWVSAARAVPFFVRLLRGGDFDGLVSTGSAVAVPAFLAARSLSLPTLYIESLSRVDGPSLTGKIVSTAKLASNTWTQHESWSSSKWGFRGSVLDHFDSHERSSPLTGPVFVTVGTSQKYSFERLASRVHLSGIADETSCWQLGNSTLSVPGERHDFISSAEFDNLALRAKAVITHAGVGSILRLLTLGIYPIVVARRSDHGEAVDDHQTQIAELLVKQDLALVADVDSLQPAHIEVAARRCVSTN